MYSYFKSFHLHFHPIQCSMLLTMGLSHFFLDSDSHFCWPKSFLLWVVLSNIFFAWSKTSRQFHSVASERKKKGERLKDGVWFVCFIPFFSTNVRNWWEVEEEKTDTWPLGRKKRQRATTMSKKMWTIPWADGLVSKLVGGWVVVGFLQAPWASEWAPKKETRWRNGQRKPIQIPTFMTGLNRATRSDLIGRNSGLNTGTPG